MVIFKPFPEGPAKPSLEQLEIFWQRAKEVCGASDDSYEVRCISVDEPSTAQVLQLIRDQQKTGTFSLPWALDANGFEHPKAGDCIVFTAYDGTPSILVRLKDPQVTTFGRITEEHISVDGPPLRALDVWKPLHFEYWNRMLSPLGREVRDEMPVIVEPFEFLYAAT